MALFELKCPDLDYVYRMSWAEFRIRLFAFLRTDKQVWIKTREIAFNALIAPNVDPKYLPKTRNAFMALDGTKKEPLVSEANIKRIKEAQEEYKNRLKLI